MGRWNYLIKGFSGTGKTSVMSCSAAATTPFMATASWLTGAIRKTGEPMEGFGDEHHIWM